MYLCSLTSLDFTQSAAVLNFAESILSRMEATLFANSSLSMAFDHRGYLVGNAERLTLALEIEQREREANFKKV